MNKSRLFLLGAGKIGRMIVDLLMVSGDYSVCVGDHDESALQHIARDDIRTLKVDVEDAPGFRRALAGSDMVVSAGPYTLTPWVAAAAKDVGAHYFDMTEDVASTRAVRALACDAKTVLMPQCGLAPGFIGIVGFDLAKKFDVLHTLQMRVGALPQFPTNVLKYNLTWSTDGLINEYCNPCEAIVDGRVHEVAPLEGYERFALDGVDYEAFNTSGGLGTLCETLAGKVRNMDYKTVRYPGHRDICHLLVNDLLLKHRRHILKDVLENAVPITLQDVVLVFVTASGLREGKLTQESFATKIYGHVVNGQPWSAIQITTAAGICAAVDLVRSGKLAQQGFIGQEQVVLADFLENRFGAHYRSGHLLTH